MNGCLEVDLWVWGWAEVVGNFYLWSFINNVMQSTRFLNSFLSLYLKVLMQNFLFCMKMSHGVRPPYPLFNGSHL